MGYNCGEKGGDVLYRLRFFFAGHYLNGEKTMDELTSALMDSAEGKNPDVQTIRAPQSTTEETSDGKPVSTQDSGAQTAATPSQRRNLYEDPDVRALVSARDRAYAQQMAAIQQQYAELQRRYEELATKDMDDVQRAQWMAQKAQEEAARYRAILEQQQQAQQLEEQKRQDLQKLSSLTGVPVEKLSDATTYDEAVERAIKLMRGEIEQQRAANKPYLGGGTASTPAARHEAEIREAFRSNNAPAAVRAILFEE